jgi:FKBP-type peptidyl-prolyl cis-trans isomerase 2
MKYSILKTAIIYTALFLTVSGCSTTGKVQQSEISMIKGPERIVAGDRVMADFTCRFKDGDIVMTTDSAIAENIDRKKSPIFLPLKEYGPIELIAGSEKKGPDYGQLKTFENELLENISLAVIGMDSGIKTVRYLTAEDNKNLTDEDRFIEMTHTRRSPRERKIHPMAFKNTYKREPVKGEVVPSDKIPGVTIEILSVTENEAVIRINVKEGTEVYLPLGKGYMREAGDYIETIIDIQKGHKIRSGGIMGRVVDMGEEMFRVDYVNPFGGETLECEIRALKGEAVE